MESHFDFVRDSMQAASSKTDASIAGMQNSVSSWAAQCAHLYIFLQQLVANQAAPGGAFRDRRDARERLMQMSQLVDDSSLWKKSEPQRHCGAVSPIFSAVIRPTSKTSGGSRSTLQHVCSPAPLHERLR